MLSYIVTFQKVKVGILNIDERENKYQYIPLKGKEVNGLKARFPELEELFTFRNWGKPIRFFESRMSDAQYFTNKKLQYVIKQTDGVELHRLQETLEDCR